jgi:hypothetical protein
VGPFGPLTCPDDRDAKFLLTHAHCSFLHRETRAGLLLNLW